MKVLQVTKWIFVLVPVTVYLLFLSVGVPQYISRFFQVYSPNLFLIVLCLNCLVLRERSAGLSPVLLSLLLALFALPLIYLWTTTYSDNKVFAGFLPYKDGKNFYLAAQKISSGYPAGGSSQGTWRPLFPGLLSSLLLFTAGNLQWSLAMLVLLAAVTAYLSARQILPELGVFAAGYYLTLLYFYIQAWLGYTMSEIPGFIFGCLGFALLWRSAGSQRILDLLLGLFLLVIGVSARAGAFLIFPALAVWAGWAWRAEKRFSFRAFFISIFAFIFSLAIIAWLYPRLLGITESTQGNFAYTIYGQVRGGIGWLQSVKELNTSKPELVYAEAYRYFLRHPSSLLIGAAKSYRDFFAPGYGGIFGSMWRAHLPDTGLWIVNLALLLIGLVRCIKQIHSAHAALALAGFFGIFFSIPFLPPIDGGSRFYASTMPFFFVLPAFVLKSNKPVEGNEWARPLYSLSYLLIFMTVLLPPLTQRIATKVTPLSMECTGEQVPFMIRVSHGSYLDLQPDSANSCGTLPKACLSDFRANGKERGIEDFFDEVLAIAEASETPTRLLPGYNLLEDKMYYFTGHPDQLQEGIVAGCALEDFTSKQKILIVQSTVK